MWVANDNFVNPGQSRVYAYMMPDKERDADKDVYIMRGVDWVQESSAPASVCSNGETMWVVEVVEHYYAAYDMSDRDRDSDKDIALGLGGIVPSGLWCDADSMDTMWVASQGKDQILSYTISTRQGAAGTIDLAAGNDEPWGIWSDGETMWVADNGNDKIYAYALPATSALPGVVSIDRITNSSAVVTVDLEAMPYEFDEKAPLWIQVNRGGYTRYVLPGLATAEFTLTDMQPETEYTVKVTFDENIPLGRETFTTTYAKVGGVNVTGLTSTDATVTVSLGDVYVERLGDHEFTVGYGGELRYNVYLRYKRRAGGIITAGWSDPVVRNFSHSAEFSLSGLEPGTEYGVQVYFDPEFTVLYPNLLFSLPDDTYLTLPSAFTTRTWPTAFSAADIMVGSTAVSGNPIWTATMTTASVGSGLYVGYQNTGFPGSTLTPDVEFTYSSVPYTVDTIRIESDEDARSLAVGFPALPQ